MGKRSLKGALAVAAAIILAALPAILAGGMTQPPGTPQAASRKSQAAAGHAAQMTQPSETLSETLVEITGGSGSDAWRLRYGLQGALMRMTGAEPLFAVTAGDRAWYAFGSWLRQIDTREGRVIGRWHLPGVIASLRQADGAIDLELHNGTGPGEAFRRTVHFDPSSPSVPILTNNATALGYLELIRGPRVEAEFSYASVSGRVLTTDKSTPENIRQLLPLAEEAVRRDPLSPWFRVRVGKLLRDAGDARATAVFREALGVPSTDFTELLPISVFFDELGDRELARAAYEAGCRDFWARGNDPRLFSSLISKISIYDPFLAMRLRKDPEYHRELMERVYRLNPNADAAQAAWIIYADHLERSGQAAEARKWRERAEEAGTYHRAFVVPRVLHMYNAVWFLIPACLFAGLFLVLVRYVQYAPQRRLTIATRKRQGLRGGFRLFNIEYWNRRERLVLLTVAVVFWLLAGVADQVRVIMMRGVAMPISMTIGKLAGPETESYLKRLPATPERDCLLAMLYQQQGENEEAERLYRSVPQFAESWNNLGVLLKNGGRGEEAAKAFEQALGIDPKLAEAALNTGLRPKSTWTELHETYVPGRPMLAPPRRGLLEHALVGGSYTRLFLWALAGGYASPEPMRGAFVLLIPLLFAIAVVFLIPSREVTQPPGKNQWVGELLFAGVNRAWGWAGGLALVAWLYFIVQLVFLVAKGTASIIFQGMPSLEMHYGVPASQAEIRHLVNPSWVWLYLAPAVLFAFNLWLVIRDRLPGRRAAVASGS